MSCNKIGKCFLVTMAAFMGFTFSAKKVNATTLSGKQYSDSVDFVQRMANGWNLGNTFDSWDLKQKGDETQWGNPRVTKELLKKIKDEGYNSIRIPFSVVSRQDEENNIDPQFLSRYKQVVDWALNDGFYVITDLHADAYAWLKNWDGNEDSPEYARFTKLWEQLADTLKDENDHLIFESINEPSFKDNKQQYKLLNKINVDFYNIIRKSGGNNRDRYLMLPTIGCTPNSEGMSSLDKTIQALKDPRIIATVHYYSQYVYSNNIGKTSFDEKLFKDKDTTPRSDVDDTFKLINKNFTDHGIGTVIGEWGLLGYNRGNDILNPGETHKYIEYMGEMQRKNPGICLMLWDNGQHFDRQKLVWKNKDFGQIIHASLTTNSAYGRNYDQTFIDHRSQNVSIPMVFNGNQLISVTYKNEKLIQGKDYQVNANKILLMKRFIQRQKKNIGKQGTLVMKFNRGAEWKQTLNYINDRIKLGKASTIVGETLEIPVKFNGDIFKSASLMDKNNKAVNNNNWQDYLVNKQEIYAEPSKNKILLSSSVTKLLTDSGQYNLVINTYNGKSIDYVLTVKDKSIVGKEENK